MNELMKGYILAHDLGTSGNKATLYNSAGKLCASSVLSYETKYLKPNWIEQDPNDWWHAVCESTKDLIKQSKIELEDILCITFSGQMMGCILVDDQGEALRNSLIWADMRAKDEVETIKKKVGMKKMYQISGNRLSESYTAAKLLWIKKHEPEIYKKAYKVLQAKDYIIAKLTGNFVTDYSDATGTNMFDMIKKEWSEDILDSLEIDKKLLPELHMSTDIVGKIRKEVSQEIGLLEGTRVVIGGADGACATVGAGSVEIGSAYNIIGTSSWVGITDDHPHFDEDMRTFNINHLDSSLYFSLGTMQSAGHSFNWFKENFGELEQLRGEAQGVNPYDIINQLILESKPGADYLIYLPYLLGERSPWWDSNAKGTFIGITPQHTRKDFYRSVLEGVGFHLKLIIDILDVSDGLTVIGGGAKNKVWLQILADIWQKEVVVLEYLEEATSLGAAICGGIGIGLFKDFTVIKELNKEVLALQPRKEFAKIYDELYSVFQDSYNALAPIYKKISGLSLN